ncbi:MAG TPA: hypothetical protein VNG29_01180 [Candidatus Paceibacterota bacterium]|nr:hypothetical protein [Candidatus Paceibacterota bacterium]
MDLQGLARVFTEELNPAIQAIVLPRIADGRIEYGWGNSVRDGKGCLFVDAYAEVATKSIKEVGEEIRDLTQSELARKIGQTLGLETQTVLDGMILWDSQAMAEYVNLEKDFRGKIREFFEGQLAAGYRENAERDRAICEEFRHVDAETAVIIDK